jgi:3-oxoacyl-[acyl-carrier protein] reductase
VTDREVVLVTGARKGIGRKLVEHFAAAGALVEGCSRDLPDWSLPGYTHHQADVTDESQVRAMLADIRKRHSRLDTVINNAGVASMNHLLLTPTATAERIMSINFMGTLIVSRESARVMQRRRYGRIINLSTVAVPLRLQGEAIYAASKSAVEMLTRVMAHELGEYGITVNAVGPTPTETDLIKSVPRDKIDGILDRLSIKRLGTFDDIVNVVDFFARRESDYVTGQVIYLGGVS